MTACVAGERSNTVQLWRVDLAAATDAVRWVDRILRSGVRSPTGPIVVDRRCRRCGDPTHGKPRLPGDPLRFSVSHTSDVLVVAVAFDREVGVDVEHARDPVTTAELAGRWCTPLEQAYVASATDRAEATARVWARKEALLKAVGTGLAVPPDRVDVVRSTTLSSIPGVPEAGGPWQVRDVVELNRGSSVVAVAAAGTGWRIAAHHVDDRAHVSPMEGCS